MKPCDNCTNKGKLLGLTKATYCENCIHGATFLRDLYMPKPITDQALNVIISLKFKEPMASQEAATLVGKIQEMLLADADFWRQYPSTITTEFYHEPSKELSA